MPPTLPRAKTFDVICAGEAQWRLALLDDGVTRGEAGVLHVARLLARSGLAVGLATVLDDDSFGRRTLERVSAAGIDVEGVKLEARARSLVVVDAHGGRSEARAEGDARRELDVPEGWSSSVLLLSGLSPFTAAAAGLCKAARRARRNGATVVLDFTANLRLWAGRDPRTIAMVLREADVVRCSFADLAVVGLDAESLRRTMRPGASLVLSDPTGTSATGPFGVVQHGPVRPEMVLADGAAEACTAAICAELARPTRGAESTAGRWHRVLERWTADLGRLSESR